MPSSSKLTKAQIITALAEGSGLEKKAINSVFESMSELIKQQLGPNGPGEITLPGLVKLKAKDTPAQPEKQGINPFTKEPTTIKAKPASRKIRATPVKALKDLVGA